MYADVSLFPRHAKPITRYRKFWAKRFGTASFLPTSRAEMDALGWDSCDIIIVTGDAYVDHPSFGMAVIGRTLEAQGFRVGIIAQPDWQSAAPFAALGRPNLYFGVTAGNMDSMINRYTAERKIRSDDAYTPGGKGGSRPDRCSVVYAQRCREAFKDVPIVLGGIEGSLRRIAHYDYWQDKVRRSILLDARADILLYGNAERAIIDISHRLAAGEAVRDITDVRGTAFVRREPPAEAWLEIDSTEVDRPGRVDAHINPYHGMMDSSDCELQQGQTAQPADKNGGENSGDSSAEKTIKVDMSALRGQGGNRAQAEAETVDEVVPKQKLNHRTTVIRLPSFEQVRSDPVLYAHANRVLHLETNPGNARALVQRHGTGSSEQEVWINPPPIPLTTAEMDHIFDLPYARSPHPRYADKQGRHDGATKIPAWEMIRFSVNIMRGCFGGCTFCSITEHEGRIIQSRSEDSIIREIEDMRDKVDGFTGVVSDLGGPTANMYRIGCKSPEIEAACRKPSCVYPGICSNLKTDHSSLVKLYKRARDLKGVKKILIGSGLRYDLAVESPEYVKELVQHHVGGYLKIAPEHTEAAPLSKMMKPGIGTYDKFKRMFEQYSKEAGKEQYLIPYFIAAHPGTKDEDMMNLALWLKRNGFRADQVQTFYPSPMATATAMYHSGKNPLRKVGRRTEAVDIVKSGRRRRLHKAFLRYHDANNWPLLRQALKEMGRADLIGNGKKHLIPTYQPVGTGFGDKSGSAAGAASGSAGKSAGKKQGGNAGYQAARRKNSYKAGAKKSVVTEGRTQRGKNKVKKSNSQPGKGKLLTQHTGLPPRRRK